MPGPEKPKQKIWPVFLPFWGCKQKCIFCAQDLQTGMSSLSLEAHFQMLRQDLALAWENGHPPLQLGFFGGTFTALPLDWQYSFLDLAREFRDKGFITRIRCSTRPDRINAQDLQSLRLAGMDLVELGIQSFSSRVLAKSCRGYDKGLALKACTMVQDAGLDLGVQLMPGLPGHNRVLWLQDIRTVCSLQPAQVRIYPCLVLRKTALETLWSTGQYRPWDLDFTVHLLARGVLKLWRFNILVTRMGLPQEETLVQNIRAGPWHPALGDLVQSNILLHTILTRCLILGSGPKRLFCPDKFQGQIWGQSQCHLPLLEKLGISKKRTLFYSKREFLLQKSNAS